MTWPAPDLRIDFQNATVSADTHPGAHNATNLSLNDDYRPEIVRIGNELLTYLPLSGGTVTGALQVDGVATLNADGEAVTLAGTRPYMGVYFGGTRAGYFGYPSAASGGQTLLHADSNTLVLGGNDVLVNTNLWVTGTINGSLVFGIAEGIDTADLLDRAETATMPVIDDDGVATADADVESVTVNEVVTALLAKVKQLSAEIEELKGA